MEFTHLKPRDEMQIKSISYKLVFMILLVSSVATFIFTAFSYYRDFQKDMNTLNVIVSEVSKTYKKSLSRALFSYDDEQIRTQLKGMLALPDVTNLRITSISQGKSSILSKKTSRRTRSAINGMISIYRKG